MLVRLVAAMALVATASAVLAQAVMPDGSAAQKRDATRPTANQDMGPETARKGSLGSFRPLNQIACEFLGPCGKCDCSPVQTPQINAPK